MEHIFLSACEEGATNLVSKYIRKGLDVNIRDATGKTGLMKACLKGEYDIVKILLDAGAHINLNDFYGQNALHFAAQGNNEKICKLLCVNKIDSMKTSKIVDCTPKDYLIKGTCNVEGKFVEPNYVKQLNGIKSSENTNLLLERDEPSNCEERIYNMIMRYEDMNLSELESDGDDKTGGEVYKKTKKKKRKKSAGKGKKKSGKKGKKKKK
ncbi:unnamed protein product [Brachionus calyciflorus]|uniref:Ankyrin repeat domain-containing protein n=1 Tax=Brachionus calyciflorus TaxID=104777 RepID=A0A813WM80_9BILA|nr:unnamed protein product [Brachionus calyciflorus]